MKLYFIFFNVVLFALCGVLCLLHFRHAKPLPDAILSQSPETSNSSKRTGLFDWSQPRLPSSDKLVDKNVFDPNRGQVEAAPPPPPAPSISEREKKRIELVGVCKINDFQAAIITDKTKQALKEKHHYRLGEKLGNGYEITEIKFDAVTLKSGSDSIVLTLDHGDTGSDARTRSLPPIRKVTVSPSTATTTETPPATKAGAAPGGAPQANQAKTQPVENKKAANPPPTPPPKRRPKRLGGRFLRR